MLFALGSAELAAARPTGGIDRLRDALDLARDTQTRLDAAHELVWALTYAGRTEEAFTLGTERLAGSSDGQELALRFEGELAAISQFSPALAKPALERLTRYEGRLRGATGAERVILACLAHRSAHRDESATHTAQLAQLALADGRLLHDQKSGAAPYFLAVWALVYADRLEEADRYFGLAVDLARERGSQPGFDVASSCRCHVLIRQGRLAQAEAEALSVLSAIGADGFGRSMLLSCLLKTITERSEPQRWEAFLAEHDLDGDLEQATMASLLLFSRGQLRLAANDPRAALADFAQIRGRDELSALDTAAIPARACQALAHAQLGEFDAARALTADELQRARRWNTPSALGFALRTAGLVEGGAGGIELLRESAAVLERSPALYERARSLTEFGAALRRAGHRRDARDPLRHGLDLAARCGANRLARGAREELVASGARPRRTALRGSDALTPSERRIAQLAAAGLANRDIAQALFVTVRTVETHLSHAYAKLDVQSRKQLARALEDTRQANPL